MYSHLIPWTGQSMSCALPPDTLDGPVHELRAMTFLSRPGPSMSCALPPDTLDGLVHELRGVTFLSRPGPSMGYVLPPDTLDGPVHELRGVTFLSRPGPSMSCALPPDTLDGPVHELRAMTFLSRPGPSMGYVLPPDTLDGLVHELRAMTFLSRPGPSMSCALPPDTLDGPVHELRGVTFLSRPGPSMGYVLPPDTLDGPVHELRGVTFISPPGPSMGYALLPDTWGRARPYLPWYSLHVIDGPAHECCSLICSLWRAGYSYVVTNLTTWGHARPVEIQDLLPADTRFKILIFLGSVDEESRLAEINALANELSSPTSFFQIYSADGQASAPMFDLITIVAGNKENFNYLNIPPVFRPYWSKVLLDDTDATGRVGGDGYKRFGISSESVTFVIVRPDGHIGMVAPVAALQDVQEYFASFLLPRHYSSSL
ncbi:thioredoxin-like protein [Pisolithus albus]|nr:thioredoxin-like protein [Pisolithus albus]